MSFDIYGNYLRPGYCEVHPDHREEYPCSRCYAEYEEYYRQQKYDVYVQREGDWYYMHQHAEALAALSRDGVDLRPIWIVDDCTWITEWRPHNLPKGYK